jgi:hypothetical protein
VSERAAAPVDEVITLCRRLRLKYVREQVEEVVLTARAQRWDPTVPAITEIPHPRSLKFPTLSR